MDLIGLINISKLSSAAIAKGIGMKRGTFNNKLKGNNNTKFTLAEEEQIRKFITDFCETLLKDAK